MPASQIFVFKMYSRRKNTRYNLCSYFIETDKRIGIYCYLEIDTVKLLKQGSKSIRFKSVFHAIFSTFYI